MAITLVDSTATGNATNTSSRTIAVPAGVANKTVVIIDVGIFSSGLPTSVAITGGAGSASFAQYAQGITGSDQVRSFWKRLDAADTGNYTITITGGSGHWLDATAVAYNGVVETGNPYEDVDTATNNAANAPSVTSTVTTSGAILHWHAYNANPAVSHTPPTGPAAFTELEDFDCGTAAWLSNPSTGSNVISGATESGSGAGNHVVVATVLKPEATGPDPDDPGYGYLLTGSGNRLIVDGGTGKLLLGTDELPPSGTNYTVTPTDNLGLTDSPLRVQGHGHVKVDPLGLADTAVVSLAHVRNVSDAMGLTDSAQAGLVLSQSVVDALNMADTATLAMGLSSVPTDAIGLTDAAVMAQSHARLQIDALGLADSAVAGLTMPMLVGDTLGLTDSAAVNLGKVVLPVDALGLTDTPSIIMPMTSNPIDAEGLSDSAQYSIIRAVIDAMGNTDASTVSQSHSRIVSDNLGLTDLGLVAQFHIASLADALGLSDAAQATLYKLIPIDVGDLQGLTDTLSAAMGLVRAVTDNAALSDTTQVGQGHGRSTVDNIGLVDNAVVSRALALPPVDSMGITDTASASWVLALALQDSLGLSDTATATLMVLIAVSVTDGLAMSDTVVRQMALGLVRSDTASLTDGVAAAMTARMTQIDGLGLDDDVRAFLHFPMTVGDSCGLSDSVNVNLFGSVIPAGAPTATLVRRRHGGTAAIDGGETSHRLVSRKGTAALSESNRAASLGDTDGTGELT